MPTVMLPLLLTRSPIFSRSNEGRVGDTSFPLMMNGRKLADIVVAPDHAGIGDSALIGVNENNYGVQTLRHVDNPNEEEEKWLLALAILETTFHGHWMI